MILLGLYLVVDNSNWRVSPTLNILDLMHGEETERFGYKIIC